VHTLLDRGDRHERHTAIIAHELARHNIDIAALSETLISGSSQFEEVSAGYTFFCHVQPAGEMRHGGVGFAIRTKLLTSVRESPCAISPRLMKFQLNLEGGYIATLFSCYAPTLAAMQEDKEQFYDQLSRATNAVPFKHQLFILGDFNARVGKDFRVWNKILGHHGIGNENANGSLLLEFCMVHNLVVTNTVFQQADKYKGSWMHPHSGHWHLIDFVFTRQRDLRNIRLTHAMRATTSWSDHRLVRTSVFLTTKAVKRTHKALRMKRLNVAKLQDEATCLALQEQLDQALSGDDTGEWPQFKSAVYDSEATVIGFSKSHHRDWFDDQDVEARQLLDTMRAMHLAWINDKSNSSKKAAYTRARGAAQKRLRQVKNEWWANKAQELQHAADRRDTKTFYHGLRAVYGPRDSGSVPVRCALSRWFIPHHRSTRHIISLGRALHSVLNQTSSFDPSVLNLIPNWAVNLDLIHPPTVSEVYRAVNQMASGKAPGTDGLPAEVFKAGGPNLITKLA